VLYNEAFPTAKVADFQADLKFSHDQADAPFWGEVYREAFPDMDSMTNVRKDGWAQRGGIDRIITTTSGRTWKIDEKVRREKWNDILLEMKSDIDRDTPGWVVKDLVCDFIAYAFLPTQECYLLPIHPLQRAWRLHGALWVKQYGTKKAPNKGWWTLSCPVPIPILMRKISEAMFIRWKSTPIAEVVTDSDIPW
jgi:hypothetical protein